MASHRVGLSGLPDPGPSTHLHHLPYASFFNQEGSSLDFGELEEAIVLQGLKINNDEARLPLYTSRPAATLEMFPSWPIKALELHSSRVVSSRSRGESSDSGGYTISSSKTEGGNGNNLEPNQEESNINTNTNNNFQDQESPFLDQKQLILHHLQTQNHQEMDHDPNTQLPSQSQLPPVKKPSKDKRKGPGSTSERSLDAKTLRRLAQNREAARKSRLRKKAYVQQLESSRIRLSQLEQDLQRARSQGLLLGSGGISGNTTISSGAAIFDMEYARWLDEDHRHMAELRSGLHAPLSDNDLRLIVDGYIAHCDEIFRLKSEATKADVFHLVTGMWATPAERCFLWMGGFRPSELIKMLIGQLDLLLTEQQVMGIYSLQHSSQQAEEALSQGFEQLQQSLVDTIAGGSLNDGMHHMVVALGKLSNLEGFVRQADNLRQQTLHQLHRVLTVRQAARCFLVIGEYYARLRALSSLWVSRPRETMMSEENSCQTTTDLQMVQSSQNQFVNF